MSDTSIGSERPQVYWLGGSPCSGKSSIAEILVAQYDLQSYRGDDFFEAHTRQARPELQPTLHLLARLSWDEIWMQPQATLLQREIEAYREEFPFIQADLAKLAAANNRPILAEGAALMPDLAAPYLSSPRHGIWVVPDETFQRRQYSRRPWIQDILRHCSYPEQAFQNWMDRDVTFARWITERAIRLGLTVMVVDGNRTIEENATIVAEQFQLQGA